MCETEAGIVSDVRALAKLNAYCSMRNKEFGSSIDFKLVAVPKADEPID